MENWFEKLFINEAKAALQSRGSSGSGGIQSVSSASEMEEILANATDEDINEFYLYTGETTEEYENGALYRIEKE